MMILLISFLTLFLLEVILGIDNLVLLAVLTDPLPAHDRARARFWGLTFAWVTRLILLWAALWVAHLNTPILRYQDWQFSYRDLLFIVGGLFLLFKATQEIHQTIAPEPETVTTHKASSSRFFWMTVFQVGLMDIIFSLDSVMTAVGLTQNFAVMAAAITGAILVMLFAAKSVTQLIKRFPTLKMLALSFLLMIGVMLIADGCAFHIPRGYIYFAMCFSIIVETLNLLRSKNSKRRRRA